MDGVWIKFEDDKETERLKEIYKKVGVTKKLIADAPFYKRGFYYLILFSLECELAKYGIYENYRYPIGFNKIAQWFLWRNLK